MRKFLWLFVLIFTATELKANTLTESIKLISPSVVAIGIHNPTGSPRISLVGTGFAVADGKKIVTNYHVIATATNTQRNESYVVLAGTGSNVQIIPVINQKTAPAYDLAVLDIETAIPAAALAGAELQPAGTEIGFTGFPITNVLGLYPATHRGIISAITPIAAPADNSTQLQAAALKRLQQPYMVYQLDATAYPGNSGSPLYNVETAQVIGIINKVFVKSTKEAVLKDPSAITYAIPVQFLLPLLSE